MLDYLETELANVEGFVSEIQKNLENKVLTRFSRQLIIAKCSLSTNGKRATEGESQEIGMQTGQYENVGKELHFMCYLFDELLILREVWLLRQSDPIFCLIWLVLRRGVHICRLSLESKYIRSDLTLPLQINKV